MKKEAHEATISVGESFFLSDGLLKMAETEDVEVLCWGATTVKDQGREQNDD
jgi:hypothetical protein